MKIKSLITGVLTAVAALTFSGCSSTIINGTGTTNTYIYSGGTMKGTENVALDQAWSATQAAIKDLEFTVINQQKDALAARLTARTALDRKVEVELRKVSENLTEVRVHAGSFGDQNLSYTVVRAIQKRR